MTIHRRTALGVAIALALAAGPAAAQDDPPRTPWETPDLTGLWDFRSITPMQRPSDLRDREFLTEEEVADLEQQALDRLNNFLRLPAQRTVAGEGVDSRPDGGNGSYNHTWLDQGLKAVVTGRTSLIIDPPNGRYPRRTPEGQARAEVWGEHRRNQPADSWLDFSTYDRCLLGFNAGPPMTPSAYNNNVQVFQTPDTVALVTEMVNTARIVPLDGRPVHNLRQWSGESRGHWDGDTLVIETTNFESAPAVADDEWRDAPDRAADARRRRDARLPGDDRRSGDLDQALDVRGPDDAAGRREVGVRLPRGTPLDARHARWRPRA